VARTHAARTDAETEYARAAELRKRELVAQSVVDQALAARNQRRAETDSAEAALRELTAGTRPEQVEQAAAAVDAARATLATLELTRARLTVRAPRAGRVDALPFRAGDQPPVGAVLVSLLVGDAPYARVFVPAPRRATLAPGAEFDVHVEGVATPFGATLRSISSEPSFTPYYALSGDDASRLVYRAELVLDGGAELPAGLPVTATVR
jgi:HlyD family secretion protein